MPGITCEKGPVTQTAIHFVGYHPRKSVQARAIERLETALTRENGGDIAFRFDPDIGDLGHKAADLLSLVEDGEIDLCYFYASYLTDRVPELGLFELPFEISERERAYRLLDGSCGDTIAKSVAKNTGYRVLAFWDNGIRHISNRIGPIRQPDDCKGLKIRTARNAIHKAAFRAIGFEPLFIDVKDLAAAVAEGTVDAQENPLTNVVNYGVQQFHRYITLTSHLFGVSLVLANARKYDSWPDTARGALADGLAKATEAERAFSAREDIDCAERLTTEGTVITELTETERAAFRHAVADIVGEERARFTPELLSAFDTG